MKASMFLPETKKSLKDETELEINLINSEKSEELDPAPLMKLPPKSAKSD